MGEHSEHFIHANSSEACRAFDHLTRAEQVLEVYRRARGPGTDRQVLRYLVQHAGVADDMNSVRPAITTLIDAGELIEVGTVVDSETGMPVRQVRIPTAEERAARTAEEASRPTILRMGSRRQWVVVDRALATNRSLSFRARGLALWLMAQPDDWQIRTDSLCQWGTEGRDAMRSATRELEAAGYLTRHRTHDEQGLIRWEWLFQEDPVVPAVAPSEPDAGNPRPGQCDPRAGNQRAGNQRAENPRLPSNKGPNTPPPAHGLEAAMGGIEEAATPPAKGPDDLVALGIVSVRDTGDRIVLTDLIKAHGWDRVYEVASGLKCEAGRRCLVSAIENRLAPPPAAAPLADDKLDMTLGRLLASRLETMGLPVRVSWPQLGAAAMAYRAALVKRLTQWHDNGWIKSLTNDMLAEACDGRTINGVQDIAPLTKHANDDQNATYARDQIAKMEKQP